MGATASPATAAARLVQATVEGALREARPAEGAAATAAATQVIYMFAGHKFVAAAAAEEDDLPLLFDTRPSSGVHNSLCLVAMVLLLLWLVHLLLRLFTLRKITQQLRLQETPVVLRGLSCYADDLQRLARTHFEKVVRSHMPAAPIAMLRVRVAVQVKAVRAAPAAAAAARSDGNAVESLPRGRRFKSPAEAAGAAAAARARAAAAAEQRAAAGDAGSRPALQRREADEDPQELQVEQKQGKVGSEDRAGGNQQQEKQLLPQQEGNERQLLLGRGQRSSRELRVMPEENEERGVATAARNNRAAAAVQAAAAALGGGLGAAEDLELLVDAVEVTHIFVYWGVDVRALQRLLERKEEEPQAAARGFLQEPLRRLPRSMRQLFGRGFRSGGGAPATQSDVSRSLLELEHLEGMESSSPSAAAAAEGRRRGESNAPVVSREEHLAPSEYRLRSKLVVIPAGLNQKVLVSPRDPGCVLGSFRDAAAAGDRRRGGGAAAAAAAGDSPVEAPLVIISTSLLPAQQLLREVAHLSSTPLYEADTHVLVLRLAQPAAAHGWPGAAAPAAAAAAAPEDEAAATAEEARGREAAAAAAADGRASIAAAGATGAVEGQPVAAEIWKEIVMGGSLGRAQERLDVYGLDDGSSSSSSPPFSDKECLVCMSNPKDVMLYPCRHCSLCSDCLRSLHQERCPICRSSFSAFLTFPLRRMHSYYPPSSSSSSSSTAPAAAAAAAVGGGGATSTSAATPSSAPPASPAGGSTAVSLLVDAPASETDSAAAAAGPAPAAGAALLGVAPAGAAAAATALAGGPAAEATPSVAAADAAAADDAGALQPRSRLSPAAGATPLGGLLSQMRHYVHYDELGSDEASDSSR